MKRLMRVSLLGMFLAVPIVPAQTTTPIPEGMGTNVEMGTQVDLGTVDRSYLNRSGIKDMRGPLKPSGFRSAAWHPDGQHIFINDFNYIYMVPASGGTPRLIFDSYYIHPYNGTLYVISQMINNITGVTPDGKYLYFVRSKYGEGTGAVITVDAGGGIGVKNGKLALERLDLASGEIQSNNDIVYPNAAMSPSGKYIAYENNDDKGTKIRVIDTVSRESWDVIHTYSMFCAFIQDAYLIYAENQQLYSIPIRGGQWKQLNKANSGLLVMEWMNCSPDGNWALISGTSYSGKKLCAFNLVTGEVFDALPASQTIDPSSARFSPDGKRFCYVLYNREGNAYKIYVKDFMLPNNDANTRLYVADASPFAFGLTGNFPNPFNPSTTIAFRLPSTGAVNLSIYNITGRKVCDLVEGVRYAGAHMSTWNGRDSSGITVSSGTYIARLKMGNYTASYRMQLVK